jgi:TPR repeat protein
MSDLDQAFAAYQSKDFATARQLCAALAEQGQPAAMYLLGRMHSFGEGGPEDPAEAVRHYLAAANASHVPAQHSLAALYAQGRGVPLDYSEAMRWYRLAGEGGDEDALFKIGVMYANSQGVEQDLREAARWWQRAAEKGHAQAMLFLGHVHRSGDTGEANAVVAAEWYLKAWEAGNAEVAQELGGLVPELNKAADQGIVSAQLSLGIIYKFGTTNQVEAVRRLTQAAEQNIPEALRLLGHSYQHGEGTDKDEARAADLYLRAAELGDRFGQYNIALFYRDGVGGIFPDIDLAIRWCRRAANQGAPAAQQALVQMLAFRNRDRRDANEAVQRLVMIASSGPELAEYELVAGNGEWSVSMKKRGTIVALRGLTLDELQGLPKEED